MNFKKTVIFFVVFLLFLIASHIPGISAAEKGLANTLGSGSNATIPAQDANESTSRPGMGSDANATVILMKKDTNFNWYRHKDILPYDYAEVSEQPAPVYPAPVGNIMASRPVRFLDGGFIWVSLQSEAILTAGNNRWYYINPGEYVLTKYLVKRPVSTFKGLNFQEDKIPQGRLGWVVLDTVTSKEPGIQEYIDGEYLDKHVLVRILETRMVNGKAWLKLADKKWVDATRVARITRPERPAGIPPGVKWIDINLYEQVLVAMDGDQLVYATLVSSGLPQFETPAGLFRIWGKVRMAKMGGGEKGKDYYFLEDVPYHMYFHQGYAIHGAYWHDNFGIKQSHGCVNIAPRDAWWLFGWTTPRVKGSGWEKARPSNPGTYVHVHH
ncbi:MAG: hypothetical protein DSZ23_05735 [Thermodesulfatator sp.]|nr:MAG: hypothetical protein DSZ23_05735 [Thermodesulfatator sp.]